MSLRELWRIRKAASRHATERHDRTVTASWYTAALTRQEKLPPLVSFLSRQSDGHQGQGQHQEGPVMLANLEFIAAQYGWKIRREQKES